MYKVCIDDFSGVNVENLALLLENCGRFLLRSEETKERFGTMVGILSSLSDFGKFLVVDIWFL
jgi:regulator of nonsense transcripts 2